MNGIRMMALWSLAKMAYSQILRPLLVKAIDDPDQEWDDLVLQALDRVFEYSS